MTTPNNQQVNKSAPIRVRFTPDQVDAIKTAAAAAGTTLSEHIRTVVLNDDMTHRAIVLQQQAAREAEK